MLLAPARDDANNAEDEWRQVQDAVRGDEVVDLEYQTRSDATRWYTQPQAAELFSGAGFVDVHLLSTFTRQPATPEDTIFSAFGTCRRQVGRGKLTRSLGRCWSSHVPDDEVPLGLERGVSTMEGTGAASQATSIASPPHIDRPPFIGCGKVARVAGGAGVNDGCHGFTGGVSAHDGRVLANPFVYPIFWGSAYSARSSSGALTREHACIASMGEFLNALRSTWLGGLSQYGVRTMGAFSGQADTLPAGGDPAGVTQGQVEQELVRFITWSQVGVPSTNETERCFVILLPTTASLSDAPGACGYHGSTYYGKASGDHNLFYAVIATTGLATSLSGDNFINSVSYCISHELAEMFSNPDGRGWFADADPAHGLGQTCEIGDICETAGTVQTQGKWTVEKFWSQSAGACFDPTSSAPTPTPTPTPTPAPHPHPPTPPRQNCQILAVRLGQLESAIEQLSREPSSPATQRQLQDLERQLATVQATYHRDCSGGR